MKNTTLARLFAEYERTFKIRYLGLPLAWSWVYCSYQTSAVFIEPEGLSIRSDDTWLVSAIVVVVAFIVGGILLRKTDPLKPSPLYLVSSVLLAAGILISALPPTPFGLSVYLSGILTGVSTALLTLYWVSTLCCLPVEKLEVIVPLSPLVTAFCALLFPSLQGVVGALATASLPLLSGLFLFLTKRELVGQDVAPLPSINLDKKAGGFLLRVSLLLGVTYLVIGWQDALSAPMDTLQKATGIDILTVLGSVAGLILAYVIVFFSKRIDFTALFRWLIPLLSISLLLFAIGSTLASGINTVLLILCGALLQAITLIYILTLAKRSVLPASLGYGLTQAFVQLGVLAGNLLGSSTLSYFLEKSEGYYYYLLIMLGLVAISSVLVPQRDEQVIGMNTRDIRVDESKDASAERMFSRKYGLSERETEILSYLIKGRSQPHIREALLISKNTVSTHVKHIYNKLGVHSRQELIDLYEDFDRRHS